MRRAGRSRQRGRFTTTCTWRAETVRLKKYLYVLRPLLATLWVEQGRGVAPMRFQDLVDGLVTEPDLRAAIDELLIHKRAAKESEHGRPWPAINQFIDRELSRLEQSAPPEHRDIDLFVLDGLLMDVVMQTTDRKPLKQIFVMT